MRKYLMGEYDCWLKHKPTKDINKCWLTNGRKSIYDIHGIYIFEDETLIKTFAGPPFAEAWKDSYKDFNGDISAQFSAFILKYIEDNI